MSTNSLADGVLRVRINAKVKEDASAALQKMGLTVSDAVRILLTRIAEEKRFPFLLEVPNAVTKDAVQEARSGKGKRYKKIDDFFKEEDI